MPNDRNTHYIIPLCFQGDRIVDVGQHCRGGDRGRQAQRGSAQGTVCPRSSYPFYKVSYFI